jgi:hypothetical protein
MSTAKWQNIAGSKKFFSYGRLFLEKYEVRIFVYYFFSKRKGKYFYTFNHFYSKKSSKRAK